MNYEEMLRRELTLITPADEGAMARAAVYQGTLAKPPGSLGELENIYIRLCGITGTLCPGYTPCRIIVLCADNGVVEESGLVSAVFAAPKSAAARRLVFPGGIDELVSDPLAERKVRIIFQDSQTTGIPMVARLASEEGILCNVISATTQKLSEQVYGSMLLGIPRGQMKRAIEIITANPNIQAEEVDEYVR